MILNSTWWNLSPLWTVQNILKSSNSVNRFIKTIYLCRWPTTRRDLLHNKRGTLGFFLNIRSRKVSFLNLAVKTMNRWLSPGDDTSFLSCGKGQGLESRLHVMSWRACIGSRDHRLGIGSRGKEHGLRGESKASGPEDLPPLTLNKDHL